MEDETNCFVTKNSLHEAVSLILGEENPKNEEKHPTRLKWGRMCGSPSLKAYNLQNAAQIFMSDNLRGELFEELRNSLLQQENTSSDAVKLIEWILSLNSNLYLPVIWKSAVALFLNYNPKDQDCLGEFLEMCAEQRDPEQKYDLMEMLMRLPIALENISKTGSKHNPNREVDDPQYNMEVDDPV